MSADLWHFMTICHDMSWNWGPWRNWSGFVFFPNGGKGMIFGIPVCQDREKFWCCPWPWPQTHKIWPQWSASQVPDLQNLKFCKVWPKVRFQNPWSSVLKFGKFKNPCFAPLLSVGCHQLLGEGSISTKEYKKEYWSTTVCMIYYHILSLYNIIQYHINIYDK